MRSVVRRAVKAARDAAHQHRRKGTDHGQRPPRWLAAHWEHVLLSLLRYGNATTGNMVTLFSNGDDAMEAVWDAIAHARRRVWVEMYLLEQDRVGGRTLKELAAAAERGCEIVLMVDSLGSANLPNAVLAALRDNSPGKVHVAIFNRLKFWWPVAFMRRDHRKIVIVDGRIGFCGGMNMSEDYAGERHGNGRFDDRMVRIEGPCVRDLASVVVSSWRKVTGEKRRVPRRSEPIEGKDTFVQVQASRGFRGRRAIQRALRLTVQNAVTHCYITTPYFIPPLRLIRAINRAAQRGVDVRILTAGRCDVPVVRVAAQNIYGRLLRHGVRIYEMMNPTLHAKTITIDGVYSTVGSFNLDTWSDQRNLECNVAIIDQEFAAQMQELFHNRIASACEVTLENWHKRRWWQRFVHWLAYQVLRL